MVRLTNKAKEFIKDHPDTSHRKLAEMLDLECQIPVSHTAVANFRKKESVKAVKLEIVTPKKSPKKTVKKEKIQDCPLSIDKVRTLLQANKDHYSYPYLNAQIFGGNYKGKIYTGKLQSDIRKLLEFLRDTA